MGGNVADMGLAGARMWRVDGVADSDVLALASGQKAMAFWLWYQSQSQAKMLAWHGFWPGLNMFQARAGPESHGF